MGDQYHDIGLVVTNTIGKVYDTSNFTTRIFKKMLTAVGIEQNLKFHDLRHTHATLLLRRKINPKVVQERLGYSSIKMTLDTYGHLMPDMQSSAADALDAIFDEIEE
jgi:integrase